MRRYSEDNHLHQAEQACVGVSPARVILQALTAVAMAVVTVLFSLALLSAVAPQAQAAEPDADTQAAMQQLEEAFAEGLNDPRYILPYALLMIRDGQYSKAKAFLVKNQKAPGMAGSQRTEMLVYYATCCLRLGDADKGINTLEQQYRKTETGLLYQTLGYLYVEKYDQANRPDFTAAETETAETGSAET